MTLKKYFFFIFVFLLSCIQVFATHNRAGEIYYSAVPGQPLTYNVSIITYTDPTGGVDRDELTLNWGDGTSSQLTRINGPVGAGGIPQGEPTGVAGIKYNVYSGTHTYSGIVPFYVISMTDPNRIAGIENMTTSVNVQFYLEDTIKIKDPSIYGFNNSPILQYPPIDFANINQVFYHNPLAFDVDGDSLHFQLVPPLQQQGTQVPGYLYPDEVNPGPDNNMTIDSQTGEIVWDVPKQRGIYNIAILISEYRNNIPMGTILRDMQIIVEDTDNIVPEIAEFSDTCIIAGTTLEQIVNATDQNLNQTITLEASGFPFEVDISPADFTANNNQAFANGFFSWNSVCEHARRQPYQVVFRAVDNHPIPLTALKTWQIKIVAPPPENLVATPVENTVELEWDANYDCAHISKFKGFSIWRRDGSNPFTPDTCDTSLADKGYIQIASGVSGNSFTDEDVVPGILYCYRIRAEFAETTPAGFTYNEYSSMPSNESCGELRRDIPVILNASVLSTGVNNGEIFVSWAKPLVTVDNLDTLQFPGPYEFKLYRSVGFTENNPVEIASFTSPTFGGLNDTTFTDTGLNTENSPYNYKVTFKSNNDVLVGNTENASSIFLSINPSDQQLQLEWEVDVPWRNDSFFVYRYDDVLQQYDSIATVVDGSSYTDFNLENNQEYCYYVVSVGQYSGSNVPSPIINLSQETCAEPMDTIPPCRPFLDVTNLCDEIGPEENACSISEELNINNLRWTNPNNNCEYEDAVEYNIYFSRFPEGEYSIIASIDDITDTTYQHMPELSISGCYAITAIDSAGNESDFSNVVCVESCPCYLLPNTFTPNNDGQNDIFTPILPYRFVDKVNFQVFNRWGVKVFETTDPMLNWDGTDLRSGRVLEEGVYYYRCEVFSQSLEGSKQFEVLSGYIHLFR
ncbi:MAG: gliding motility-associated C-terminal domain-containing protein [Chitinophagaceae bacterium]|nr:MAG: gliding motility-associated C-terminal domain-containing protein [Chitinophagaceae bacterium]